jgi:peptidylprolyl isomerase
VPGATITTESVGELLDGTVFDSSYDTGFPLNFTFGNSGLIVGFELGISQLHEEDSATIFIPSIYGYGSVEKDEIPVNSVLIFGLDILSISNPN